MKNLAHEAKPAREKFRGRGGVRNGRIHSSGHGRVDVDAHFVCPCPHDLGVQHECALGVHPERTWTSSRLHDNGRPHVCNMGDQDSGSLGAHISVHAHPYMPTKFGHPYTATHIHVSTNCWAPKRKVDSHVSGNVGQPRSFGCPSHYMGNHGKSLALDIHTRPRSLWTAMQSSGCPRSFVRSHAIVWTSSDNDSWTSTRYVWIPMTFCGYPRKSLGVHEILWASTYDMWTAKPRLFGRPHIYHGHPKKTSLGRPIMWPTPRILGNHYVTGGAPRYCIGLPQYCLGDHEMLWTPNELPSWTSTRSYGRPRELVDIHARLWAPISRNMDDHHALMGDHDTIYGHPARYCGRSRYADGVPRLFMGAHKKMWTATHLGGLPQHFCGRPRNLCGWPREICGASRI